MKKEIKIYTDGSSLGNPGPGGWGVVVKDSSVTLCGGEKNTTNNRMELRAVIEALKYLESIKFDNCDIFVDSAYVLGGINSWVETWEKNGWRTSNKKEVLNQDLWKELIILVRLFGNKISWQKVKGHSGNIWNEKADILATSYASSQK